MSVVYDTALDLAAHGIAVYPKGFSQVDATANAADIARYGDIFSSWYAPTGGTFRLAVLDIPTLDDLNRLESQLGDLPLSVSVTRGRGTHHWFRISPAAKIRPLVRLVGTNAMFLPTAPIAGSQKGTTRYRYLVAPHISEFEWLPARWIESSVSGGSLAERAEWSPDANYEDALANPH